MTDADEPNPPPGRGPDPDRSPEPRPDEGHFLAPLDDGDPRYTGTTGRSRARPRELVASMGPGPSHMDPRVRILRVGLPAVVVLGLVGIGAVFVIGLSSGDGHRVVGDEDAVRAAIADRPRRVCRTDSPTSLPCAWLTVVDGRILALNTSGPLSSEFGRSGVSWCASSGGFVSNSTGSRFDAAGHHVAGPAPRGIDRFRVRIEEGTVLVNFSVRHAGPRAGRGETIPPKGPHCETIPFDRDADLDIAS